MSAMPNVPVSVETPAENQIIEVGYDGQEITQQPLTLGEHLTKQAHKIDFDSEDVEEKDVEKEEEEEDVGTKSATYPATWPWESVRNKLRDALTEMSVLADVITISTKDCGKAPDNKRYMVLDGPVQQDPPDPRPFASLCIKKKSLDIPAKILLNGAEHLRTLQMQNKSGGQAAQDFHLELLRLRQNWRLKKVSNTILGDLSYRTAGSQYKQSGVFEVTKADNSDPSPPSSPGPAGSAPKNKCALKVTVPSELEGIAYIQVTIQKESEQLVSANLSNLGAFGSVPQDVHWQQKLEAAQNVLFCKELFSQLAKEAIQLQAPIPHMVVGNQITASLFTDIQLIISLCHSTGQDGAAPQSQKDHSHVLEHSLHQLLRMAHSRNINPGGPCLSSAPVGISKRRRLAGPQAADRHSLLDMAKNDTLLEQIIKQAQHVVLRLRTMFVLDTMARELKDPLLTCHWSTLSSPTRTSVKVNIITSGYDTILRTQLVIHVGEKQLTVVCKDGRVLHFSHEPQELRDFIWCQITHHQVSGVQALAKVTGWQILTSSTFLGVGSVEPLGNAAGCLMCNSAGDRFIAVRHSPHQATTSAFISNAPCKDFFSGSILKDRKWENLPDDFQELRLDKMDGKNLLSKLELLMAAMSNN